MPGIPELLDLLERAAVPVAIASSSPARWVVPAATRLGIASRVGAIVTADDVSRRKPDPEVYVEALRRLGAEPDRSVAIEDSGPGVAAAVAAGLWTVAIPHSLTASARPPSGSSSGLERDRVDARIIGSTGRRSADLSGRF